MAYAERGQPGRSGTDDFVALPPGGRVFTVGRRVHLGDVGSSARLRLEALARFLQDVATDDGDDSGLDTFSGVWVVRRLAVAVRALPRYHDHVELDTFCSGTGPCWAERRTTMRGSGGVLVEAAALWVYLDGAGGRPQPLQDDFYAIYGVAADGRRVSSRLRHAKPPEGSPARAWPLRDADFDVLDHVNNARYWEAIEDELVARMPGRRVTAAVVEFRGAVERGDQVELVSDLRSPTPGPEGAVTELAVWLRVQGEIRMSAVVSSGAAS